MLLSNDIRMLTVALTIQKMHFTEKYYFKSPRFNAAYGRMTGYHEKQLDVVVPLVMIQPATNCIERIRLANFKDSLFSKICLQTFLGSVRLLRFCLCAHVNLFVFLCAQKHKLTCLCALLYLCCCVSGHRCLYVCVSVHSKS